MSFNHFHQSVEDIIKTATPAQRIMWNELFLRFGENITIRQFCYSGILAGSEFVAFTARKIFYAYYLESGFEFSTPNVPYLYVYDENNLLVQKYSNSPGFWDSTAAAPKYSGAIIQTSDLYFSRLAHQQYTYLRFIGFRINY